MIGDILSTLVGTPISDTSAVVLQGWHDSPPYLTGTLIRAASVYSMSTGVVISIGQDDKNNLYSVTIEYNYVTWFRYCLLKTCDIHVGDHVGIGTKIGTASKNTLRFEYCNQVQSDFPMRALGRQLYKQDPTPILFGADVYSE